MNSMFPCKNSVPLGERMLKFSKMPSWTCPWIFWVEWATGSNTVFVRKTNVPKIRRLCHMRTRFHVSKFLPPDICRRNVSMSMFPEFKSLKLIGFKVSSYICTFPTVLRCPSCLRHHGYHIYPSPSSSLRCPNSCHGRPRAHKLAPGSWGMTSMTRMTFERWDVCLKQPGSQKGGHLFLTHIFLPIADYICLCNPGSRENLSWMLGVSASPLVWDVCLKYVFYPVASTKRNKYHEDHRHCAPNINVFTRKHVTMVPSTDPSFSVSLTVLEDVLTLRFKVILHELILTWCCSIIPLAGMFECDIVIIPSWKTTKDEGTFETWILMLGRTKHFLKQSSTWSWSNLWCDEF